jgi:hypothetical protein
MNNALQIDLARDEATPQQILNSPLQPEHQDDTARDIAPHRITSPAAPKRSTRGAIVTASQARLKPQPRNHARPSSRDVSPAPRDADAFGETDKSSILQPLDKGFGAWSYVAATFAMYIVVWGMFAFQSSFSPWRARSQILARFSIFISSLPDLLDDRARCTLPRICGHSFACTWHARHSGRHNIPSTAVSRPT